MEFNLQEMQRHFTEFFTNRILLCSIIAWFTAQFIKIFTGMRRNEKTSLTRFLVGSGGMPSSHSAVVMACAFSAGILHGFHSAAFAIAAVLAVVVMRDASGVRRESGKQAAAINLLSRELRKNWKDFVEVTLTELLGHTPLQVFFGALLGILMAFLCQYWFFPLIF
jgi:acid phosphatase family membrane protein YuiD